MPMSAQKAENEKIKLRDTVRGKRYRFFDAQGVDELVSMVMALAQELWTVKERNAVIEALATEKGLITPDDIENYPLSDEQKAKLDEERQAFIDRIFFVLREEAEGLEPQTIPEPIPPGDE